MNFILSIKRVVFVLLLPFSLCINAQEATNSKPLQSEALQRIKATYEECVFDKGKKILVHASLTEAVEYAPLACRKLLLQSKKYLLNSAFKVEVTNELVESIEEGVQIDLVNVLIDEMDSKKTKSHN